MEGISKGCRRVVEVRVDNYRNAQEEETECKEGKEGSRPGMALVKG